MTIKVKKLYVGLLCTVMCVMSNISAMPANAGNISTTNVAQGQLNFSNSWSVMWTFQCGQYNATMEIGFDTWFQDEDYVDEFYTLAGNNHYAAVRNADNKIEYTNIVSHGQFTGKADVNHTGNYVSYYAYWN